MLSAIRSSHRSPTPSARLKAALPALPHPHKRRRPIAADPIVRVGLVAVPIGATAVIFRDKLASIVSRTDGGEQQPPDGSED
jgi:hypothetical protein